MVSRATKLTPADKKSSFCIVSLEDQMIILSWMKVGLLWVPFTETSFNQPLRHK
jgi:hypothetical protein